MRTPFRHLAVLCALCAALLVPAAPAAAERTVERGDRGAAVKKLQRLLNVHADGIFGKGTKRALKSFQRRRGLTADGIAGPATWRALKRSGRSASRSSGRVASRGGSVRLLQRKLGIAADGVFGPATQRAVKRFQRRRGLTPDGVVGPATWSALGVGGGHPVLKRGRAGGGSSSTRSGIPVRVRRAIRAANRIAHKPYRLGGGHRSFTDSAYDCSGSLSYVLRAAGALSSPLDSGSLARWGSPGRGRWITVYANSGHAFMVIRGRRYDTSSLRVNGSRWTRTMRSTAGYTVRHPPGL